MRKDHTDITIVLDRSGSMITVAADTIGGFNRFLADQKMAAGTASITLHQFDHEFETRIDARNVNEAQPLTDKTFVPRGNTALLDAIGLAITMTGERLQRDDAANAAPAHVVFVIITDGQENSSCKYDRAKVFEMIEHQRGNYSWEFVFLGANQDAISAAQNLGIASGNAMTYAANSMGTRRAFDSTSANLCAMRSGVSASMAYSDADRAEQQKAGATQ